MKDVSIPLNIDELYRVDEWLKNEGELDVIQLQGFFYASILSPKKIDPREWVACLFEKVPALSDEQGLQLENYFLRAEHTIREALEAPVTSYPIATSRTNLGDLSEETDESVFEAWSKGFMRGLRLDKNYWYEKNNKEVSTHLKTILTLAENDEGIVKRMGKSASDIGIAGLRRKAMVTLPHIIKSLLLERRKGRSKTK